MIGNLYQFREALKQDGVVLNFMGPLSQDLIEDIVGTVREKLKMEGVDMPTIMNVFAVAVEQSQNMIQHSRELVPEGHASTPFRLGTLLIGYEENAYFVLSGNMIENTRIDALRDHLSHLREMTKEELKQYYKQQRKKSRPEPSQGAGLGLIEIARKATQPIAFGFEKVDEHRSFFSIKTVIEPQGVEKS